MRQVMVSLPNAQHIQAFVDALAPLEGDFELVSGRHILDARSLMGIFSLDLAHPIALKIYKDSPANLEAVRPFLAGPQEAADEQ